MGDISTLLSAKEAMVRLPMDLMPEVAIREAEVSRVDNMMMVVAECSRIQHWFDERERCGEITFAAAVKWNER